ncbi:hypothetical protein MVES1_001797 [Malassezia vespertilionis]|uniref:uncharacterized protein n=1 Tax=Malassezia vespertilionis TaxID=2020962 RepID=UPI0024B06050|nr:uncharacterized protein MVES1_001797 [Malassezia vespertilionis]WFD06452.1 hypothetical protein MVES1_001797 [Malassezia vespertilionis]
MHQVAYAVILASSYAYAAQIGEADASFTSWPSATVVRRQEPSPSDRNNRDNDDGKVPFRAPFLTFAIVAVAVFLLIIFLIVLRILVWNRRARLRNNQLEARPFFTHAHITPQDRTAPPPLLEKTAVSCYSESPGSGAAGVPIANWSAIQPLSVCFDEKVTAAMRPALESRKEREEDLGTKEMPPDEPVDAHVQLTCLVAFPTEHTVFPDHLRSRRHGNGARSYLSKPEHLSLGGDRTGDFSGAQSTPKRAGSIHSQMSIKELGEARRAAYFDHLVNNEHGMPDQESATHLQSMRASMVRESSRPADLSRQNSQRVPMSHATDTGVDDDTDEFVGIFAFGSKVLPVHSVRDAVLKRDDFVHLFEKAHDPAYEGA